MKILFVASQILGKRVVTGGDVRFLEVAKRFVEKAEVQIICPQSVAQEITAKIPRAKIFSLSLSFIERAKLYDKHFFWIVPLYVERTVKALLKVWKLRDGVDVIYTNGDFFCNAIPAFFLKLIDRRKIWLGNFFHLNKLPWERQSSKWVDSFFSFIFQQFSLQLMKAKADVTILLNNRTKEELQRRGFNSKKLKVLGAGINLKFINSIKPLAKTPSFDACFLGRINYTKGVLDLPLVWQEIIKSLPSAKLAIIGPGSKETIKRLKNEIRNKGLKSNVFYLGYLSQKSVYQIFKKSKFFVFPSYEEGFGIAPLEAQALGLPVIAWDLPAFEEVFPKGMIKVEIGKIEEFTDKVLKLLLNKDLCDKLSSEAMNNAERYDWDKIAKKELKLMREVVDK